MSFVAIYFFEGVALRQWIDWLEKKFEQVKISDLQKLNLAMTLIEGEAAAYLQQSRLRIRNWHSLKAALLFKFGDDDDPEKLRIQAANKRYIERCCQSKARREAARIQRKESVATTAIHEDVKSVCPSNSILPESSPEVDSSRKEEAIIQPKLFPQEGSIPILEFGHHDQMLEDFGVSDISVTEVLIPNFVELHSEVAETGEQSTCVQSSHSAYKVFDQMLLRGEVLRHSIQQQKRSKSWMFKYKPEKPLDLQTQLALWVLDHLMLGTPASPLRKVVLECGLGEALVSSGMSDKLIQPQFSVGMKGVSEDDVQKVEELIMNTLQKLVEEGFDSDAMEASMNTIEFSLRGNNTRSLPRGLSLILQYIAKWIYDRDPVEPFHYTEPLKALKARIAEEGSKAVVFPLIEQFRLTNSHRVTIEMQPVSDKASQEEAIEKSTPPLLVPLNPSQVQILVGCHIIDANTEQLITGQYQYLDQNLIVKAVALMIAWSPQTCFTKMEMADRNILLRIGVAVKCLRLREYQWWRQWRSTTKCYKFWMYTLGNTPGSKRLRLIILGLKSLHWWSVVTEHQTMESVKIRQLVTSAEDNKSLRQEIFTESTKETTPLFGFNAILGVGSFNILTGDFPRCLTLLWGCAVADIDRPAGENKSAAEVFQFVKYTKRAPVTLWFTQSVATKLMSVLSENKAGELQSISGFMSRILVSCSGSKGYEFLGLRGGPLADVSGNDKHDGRTYTSLVVIFSQLFAWAQKLVEQFWVYAANYGYQICFSVWHCWKHKHWQHILLRYILFQVQVQGVSVFVTNGEATILQNSDCVELYSVLVSHGMPDLKTHAFSSLEMEYTRSTKLDKDSLLFQLTCFLLQLLLYMAQRSVTIAGHKFFSIWHRWRSKHCSHCTLRMGASLETHTELTKWSCLAGFFIFGHAARTAMENSKFPA